MSDTINIELGKPVVLDGQSLHEILDNAGASGQVKQSKAAMIIENALTDREISTSQTARTLINSLAAKVQNAESRLYRIEDFLEADARKAAEIRQSVKEFDKGIAQQIIEDRNLKDGLVVYGRMLATTREVFGEDNMTEQVICKAIEAASYGMWRSVMGPKDGSAGRRI